MIQEIAKVKFKHAVVPEDAVHLNISTNDADDVGKNLACTAIYARFLKKNGTHSCQLAFSLSKIIRTELGTELLATTMNTQTGEIVRRIFQGNHKEKVRLCDQCVS